MPDLVPLPVISGLSPAQFQTLADVPPELEWLANIVNLKTRRAYQNDVGEFSAFAGLRQPAELRTVSRAHVKTSKPASSPIPASGKNSPRCPRCSITSA